MEISKYPLVEIALRTALIYIIVLIGLRQMPAVARSHHRVRFRAKSSCDETLKFRQLLAAALALNSTKKPCFLRQILL